MAVFFTADWHLGETRLDIMQRDFPDAQAHVDAILANYNSVVKPDDEVFMVGDVCFDPAYLPWVAKFNGRKTLIKGNHDRKIKDEDFRPYFEKIVEDGDGIEMEYDGIPLWVTHYPSQARKDRFNIVGHIHAVWKVQLNCLNVGVDVHCFRPMPIAKIRFFHNAICNFYDEDVWAAYSEQNEMYHGLRGKKGSYFNTVPKGVFNPTPPPAEKA